MLRRALCYLWGDKPEEVRSVRSWTADGRDDVKAPHLGEEAVHAELAFPDTGRDAQFHFRAVDEGGSAARGQDYGRTMILEGGSSR